MLSKPLVITIGAMKCGTSSLHEYMRLHPDIFMSRKKETDFFKLPKPPTGGKRWYRAMLAGPGSVVGESSPNYTKRGIFPGVPERMRAAVPDAKLIYILRDPADRALSHYRHNVSHGRETRSIDEAFAELEDNNYVATSRYHEQLTYFLPFYSEERILVLNMDDLISSPPSVMKRVFEFIGVDAGFEHPDIGRVFHSSSNKGKPSSLGRVLGGVPGARHLRAALPRVMEEPMEKPRFSSELRAHVDNAFRDDVAALRAFTGESFAGWSV